MRVLQEIEYPAWVYGMFPLLSRSARVELIGKEDVGTE